MPKRTFQPSKRRRSRRLGFQAHSRTATGRTVIKRRRRHGRNQLTA